MSEVEKKIVDFLTQIGIEVREGDLSNESFLPGLRIEDGALVVDWSKLRWPGDLLHEAGHIATTPASVRASLSDALEGHVGPYDVGEPEATAWAYAACLKLGIDPSVLFHAGGYQGKSKGLLETFGFGVYPGSAGLAKIGMTCVGGGATEKGHECYPNMKVWMRA